MNKNKSHDNMSGFRKISDNTLEEVEVSEVDTYIESVKGFLTKVIHSLYSILNEIVVPFLFLGAIMRSLYTIIVFNDAWEVFLATIVALAMYYISYLQDKPYRR